MIGSANVYCACLPSNFFMQWEYILSRLNQRCINYITTGRLKCRFGNFARGKKLLSCKAMPKLQKHGVAETNLKPSYWSILDKRSWINIVKRTQQLKISSYAELQQSCYCSIYVMYIINACAFHERNVGLKQTWRFMISTHKKTYFTRSRLVV